MARTAVGRMRIECCERCCATRCAGSDTAEMTSAESWTSARPNCSWCAQLRCSTGSQCSVWSSELTSDRRGACRRYAPRCSGLTGASEWCWMERRAAQNCSSQFSRESGCIRASVQSPASVYGVCGESHMNGNCMIALQLTVGYWKSGDDPEWRQELASSLPRQVDISDWYWRQRWHAHNCELASWRALQTCLDSVGVRSAYTTAWRQWYKRREWTGRQLCCRRASLGGAECHRRIDGIGRHWTWWR